MEGEDNIPDDMGKDKQKRKVRKSYKFATSKSKWNIWDTQADDFCDKWETYEEERLPRKCGALNECDPQPSQEGTTEDYTVMSGLSAHLMLGTVVEDTADSQARALLVLNYAISKLIVEEDSSIAFYYNAATGNDYFEPTIASQQALFDTLSEASAEDLRSRFAAFN